jgi:uncharacterized surface protein with fasciclin (FAS1) repeats
MKKLSIAFIVAIAIFSASCTNESQEVPAGTTADGSEQTLSGQSDVQDDVSQKNVVQVAVGSKDHSTLVAAIKQAELVDALSNAGPFTVFAPVNAAFDKLPAGTVDDLMKDENKDKLIDILQYHVSVGVLKEDMLQDGQSIGQVNGGNITISKSGTDLIINNSAKVVASVPASNGIIYIIDGVLLPK